MIGVHPRFTPKRRYRTGNIRTCRSSCFQIIPIIARSWDTFGIRPFGTSETAAHDRDRCVTSLREGNRRAVKPGWRLAGNRRQKILTVTARRPMNQDDQREPPGSVGADHETFESYLASIWQIDRNGHWSADQTRQHRFLGDRACHEQNEQAENVNTAPHLLSPRHEQLDRSRDARWLAQMILRPMQFPRRTTPPRTAQSFAWSFAAIRCRPVR